MLPRIILPVAMFLIYFIFALIGGYDAIDWSGAAKGWFIALETILIIVWVVVEIAIWNHRSKVLN